ncbi:MAG: aminodeoxychorismate/anthranilate synthase component II [Anditalea sp.]
MLLLIDNFDSFSHILADSIRQTGADLKIVRNDIPLSELAKEEYEGLILSPGPGTPHKAGYLMEVLDYYHDKLPILGICLGHQAIGLFFGAKLVRSKKPVHGKISEVFQSEKHPVLQGVPDSFKVTRYHSLELLDLPSTLKVPLATGHGEVMALSHEILPLFGIQFHPEAHLTEYGLKMISNWVELYVNGRMVPHTAYHTKH